MQRVFDIVMALCGLVAFAPLMLVIAAAVRLDSAGSAFYTQPRIGRAGEHFSLRKFRKFRVDARPGNAVTLKNDPRMTRVGRFLERTKLDELPQLWNVLVGDMSIVGPRPETVEFEDCFVGEYQRVLDFNPGLFGPNQAIFRNESALYPADRDPHEFYRAVLFPMKARIDLDYFPRRTLLSDIGWILFDALSLCGVSVVRNDDRLVLALGRTSIGDARSRPHIDGQEHFEDAR